MTTPSPMGRLVGLVMVALVVSLIVQAADGRAPTWVTAVSIPATLFATGLAAVRVLPRAVRLGARGDSTATQTKLARSIHLGHVVCLALLVTVLGVQLVGA